MIGYLRGVLVEKQPPHLLIEVRDVGYELEAPLSTFAGLPERGQQVHLFTHLAIREDAHTLYGFLSTAERSLFRNLIRINGVGARLALTILSGLDAAAFGRCVAEGDTVSLTRLPGIGQKTAQRLIIEMRDRLPAMALGPAASIAADETPPPVADAVQALIALGYKPADAGRMIRDVNRPELSSEQLIRAALRTAMR